MTKSDKKDESVVIKNYMPTSFFLITSNMKIKIQLYFMLFLILASAKVEGANYESCVRELLDSDEVFIQFRDVKYLETSTQEYVAIIVEPSKNDVELRYLLNGGELSKYDRIDDVTNKDFSKLIWGKLSDVIKDKRRIYMSISGNLSNYPIEYLLNVGDTTKRMNESYNIYRLSNIDQLAVRNRTARHKNRAVVFGGLEYNLSTNDTIDAESAVLAFRGRQRRLKYLPETTKEVKYIDSVLRQNGIKVSLKTGKYGTSDLFRKIPSSKANLLHIATHGYYDSMLHGHQAELERWMLDRTGICFAGQYNNNTNWESAIITGADISNMNMSDLDLTVLSSCQSGLGDVYEGYQYGISAAFKISGAQSIISSLWSVNDKATCYLMERLYQHWSKSKDIATSLRIAQNDLIKYRDTSTCSQLYNSPEYWASFIAIDALPEKINTISEETMSFIADFQKNNIIGNSQIQEDMLLLQKASPMLEDNEIVVLIYNYTLPSKHDEYVAYIHDNTNSNNVIVPIFTEETEIVGDQEKMYNISMQVWHKLEEYLSNKDCVYFRPSGIMTKIPIENYIQLESEKKLYRITSLETIINRTRTTSFEQSGTKTIVLAGGIRYHKFAQLPSARQEINNIYELLNQKMYSIKIDSYVRKNILTELLQSNDIIHFSTHGGSINIEDCSQVDLSSNIKSKWLTTKTFPAVDASRHHSLSDLLLDLHVMIFNDESEDYSITALDISKLDLSGVSLCVLSSSNSLYAFSTSCQDVGFLRGLKLAGVRTILGTLWDVDDESSSLFMTRFYSNISSGKGKREALIDAQRYVREYEREETVDLNAAQRRRLEHQGETLEPNIVTRKTTPYSQPKYWAPFILIDALEPEYR